MICCVFLIDFQIKIESIIAIDDMIEINKEFI